MLKNCIILKKMRMEQTIAIRKLADLDLYLLVKKDLNEKVSFARSLDGDVIPLNDTTSSFEICTLWRCIV